MAELDGGGPGASADSSIESDGTPVVAIRGELDISGVPSVETEIERVTERRVPRLVFECSELTFMDSSGIALLLRAAARADRVEVRNATRIVRRVIDATGLQSVFHVEP